jgi:putative phosphoribosyl transferase
MAHDSSAIQRQIAGKRQFLSRRDAAKRLAREIRARFPSPLVIHLVGIACGGAFVATEIAKTIHSTLSISTATKIKHPDWPEIGIGSLLPSAEVLVNDELVAFLGLNKSELAIAIDGARLRQARNAEVFSTWTSMAPGADQPVVVVDDGLASGYTALAQMQSVLDLRCPTPVFATPVTSDMGRTLLTSKGFEVLALHADDGPGFFVPDHYHDFPELEANAVEREIRHAMATNKHIKLEDQS